MPDYGSVVLRHMTALGSLSESEVNETKRLLCSARQHTTQAELCVQGEEQYPRVLVSGWACQQNVLRNGRRQIMRFMLPGDLIGSLEWPSQPAMSTVVALTPVSLADARPLIEAAYWPDNGKKGFARLVRHAVRAEEEALRGQIVRLGGHAAYERLVHLILELHCRLRTVGLADADSFAFPVTQEMIADALGMSFVHTNRTLQQIRKDGLFVIRHGKVTIKDLAQMQDIAEWPGA